MYSRTAGQGETVIKRVDLHNVIQVSGFCMCVFVCV